jgi:hypothetical protein
MVLLWLGKAEPGVVHLAFDYFNRFVDMNLPILRELRLETTHVPIEDNVSLVEDSPFRPVSIDELTRQALHQLFQSSVFRRGWVI